MKLGLQLGYWGAHPPENAGELVAEAEAAGFDAVFTAEAWGSDAYTPLAWWGSSTQRVRLGTSVVQLSARTPTACAMAALTLDHLSGGRHILGLGVSGPQVVEGWYGQSFPKPLARTREYIDILRQVWAREKPVTSDGPHYPLPRTGEGTTGLGKPLKAHHSSAAGRHPDHAGRRRAEERRAWPPRSATAGCPSSTRRGWPTCTTNARRGTGVGRKPLPPGYRLRMFTWRTVC